MPKPPNSKTSQLYHHSVDTHGRFKTEVYTIAQNVLIPPAYKCVLENDPDTAATVPVERIETPSGRDLWTRNPDPCAAREKLLMSARNAMDRARAQFQRTERLYAEIAAAMPEHTKN